MYKAPVLLIFYNRPNSFKEVFKQVKIYKPAKLYLFQDGLKENSDPKNHNLCRDVVKNINWNCEIHINYSEKNLGCGMGPFTAISWFFENEDEGIILEDDCIPSQSFFSFCSSMLEKYRYNNKIFLISGCNLELITKCDCSYFFGYAGTNWGWATWKKNWEKMDYSCSWVKDKRKLKLVKKTISSVSKKAAAKEVKTFLKTNKLVANGTNISYWDVQWQSVRYLNNMLSIIPKYNLITNVGVGEDSTHAKFYRKINENDKPGKINFHFNKRFEFDDEIISNDSFSQNIEYDKKVYKKLYASKLKIIFARIFNDLLSLFKRKSI